MIKILFICHGNICRSPMAEFIMKDLVEKLNIKDKFIIESRATSSEEIYNGIGNKIYPPARKELISLGVGKTEYTNFDDKRAEILTKRDYDNFDYLICADTYNISNTLRIVGSDKNNKIKLLLDFAGYHNKSISDPWYTGDFKKTSCDIIEGLNGLLEYLKERKLA